MNWKFWTWPAQIRALEADLAGEHNCARVLTRRIEGLESELDESKARLTARSVFDSELHDAPMPLEQAYAAFEGVTDATPWWRMVHCVLQKEIATEQLALAQPALASEQSHFNRGRLARLLDLQAQLHTLREAAQRAK